VVYAIPRTSFVGAVVLTAFLGGATAAKVRIEDPGFFFSIAFGALAWGGLYLRDGRLRALLTSQSLPATSAQQRKPVE
jgi:hypothetical protein